MPEEVSQTLTSDVTAVLLVGGMGTRLRSFLPHTPKPLASIGERSFLDLLLLQLASQGVRRLVMCTGHLSDQIEERFGNGGGRGIAIEYSRESRPLGTAGAVKFAESHLKDIPDFLVLNGDSFVEIDFERLLRFHREHGGIITIAGVEVNDAGRYGTVRVGTESRVIGFSEKTGSNRPGLVNAGVYVFSRSVLDHIPEGCFSLENDIFPRLLDRGIFTLPQRGLFIDIGTPEDYLRARELADHLFKVVYSHSNQH